LYLVRLFSVIYYKYIAYTDSIGTAYSTVNDYFYNTAISVYVSEFFGTLLFTIILGGLTFLLWRWRGGILVDGADIAFLILGMLSSGWPNMFIFLLTVFLMILVINLLLVAFRKRSIKDRFIISPAIPAAAILTILFGGYISALIGLDVIRF
jgi:hypothetical protein